MLQCYLITANYTASTITIPLYSNNAEDINYVSHCKYGSQPLPQASTFVGCFCQWHVGRVATSHPLWVVIISPEPYKILVLYFSLEERE